MCCAAAVAAVCSARVQAQVQAQESGYAAAFGEVTAAEMKRSDNLVSRGAPAVIIHDLGHYSFTRDMRFLEGKEPFPVFRRERVCKVKILSDEGAERYGTFEFPYLDFSTSEGSFAIDGFTYNMSSDGSLSRIPLTEECFSDSLVAGDRRVRRVVFPDVRAGSVIELRCVQLSLDERMPVWYFQNDVPTLRSELVYETSPYLGYSAKLRGRKNFASFSVRDVKGEQASGYEYFPDYRIITFGMGEMPALHREEYAAGADADRRVRVEFRFASRAVPYTGAVIPYDFSWDDIGAQLLRHNGFGRYMNSSGKALRRTGAPVGGASPRERAEAIFRYVRDHRAWNGVETLLASHTIGKEGGRTAGSSADINLELAGLLAAAGLDAVPVAIRPLGQGRVNRDEPTADWFGDVLVECRLDGGVLWLDATDRFAPFGYVSPRYQGAEGMAVSGDGVRWVVVESAQKSADRRSATVSFDPAEGTATFCVERTFVGAAAVAVRHAAAEGRLGEWLGRGAECISSPDPECDADGPFTVRYVVRQVLSPGEDGALACPLAECLAAADLFGQEKMRLYPVVLPARTDDSWEVRVAVPDGYCVRTAAGADADDLVSRSRFAVAEEDGEVLIEASYSLKRSVFAATEYRVLQNSRRAMLGLLSTALTFVPAER